MKDGFDFITLETGHSMRSVPSDVDGDVIDRLAPLLKRGGGEIADWRVDLLRREIGRDLVFEISRPGRGTITRCYLGYDGPDAMRETVRRECASTSADALPSSPFLAVSLSHGITAITSLFYDATDAQDILFEAGDFEKCVAWTALLRDVAQ